MLGNGVSSNEGAVKHDPSGACVTTKPPLALESAASGEHEDAPVEEQSALHERRPAFHRDLRRLHVDDTATGAAQGASDEDEPTFHERIGATVVVGGARQGAGSPSGTARPAMDDVDPGAREPVAAAVDDDA